MSTQHYFAIFIIVIGCFRLVELYISFAQHKSSKPVFVDEGKTFTVMVVLHISLLTLPLVEVFSLDISSNIIVSSLAIAIFSVAQILRFWTLSTIKGAWNVRIVVPEEEMIVTTGPYKYIRHPNYLVVILEIASIPLIHSAYISAFALSVLNIWVLKHRIAHEEKALSRLSRWREEMSEKPRLLPRLWG